MKKIFLPLFFVIGLLITGCEQTININFSSDQNFTLEAIADLDRELMKGTGEILDSLGEDLNIDLPNALFDPEVILKPAMRLYELAFREMGMTFDWNYANNKLRYKIAGTSYSQLVGTLPSEFFSITPVDDKAYRLWIDYSYFGEEYMVFTTLVYDTEVTIRAGKIIDSNANKQTSTKATWYNPTNIDVTFIPGTPLRIGLILLILFGVVALITIISTISKGGTKSACPSCGRKIKRSATECPHCGAWL